jgi:superkiller protein 3
MTNNSNFSEEDDWFQLALIYQKKEDYSEVIENCKKILEINPNYIKAWFLLSIAYKQTGKIEDSLKAFKKTFELESVEKAEWYEIAIEYYQKEDVNELVKSIENILFFDKDKKEDWIQLASNYEKFNLFIEAYEAYRKALNIDPLDMHVLNKIGHLYNEIEEISEKDIKKREKLLFKNYKIKPKNH